MMHRLAITSLGILPLCFLLACDPIDLTIGDQSLAGGKGGASAAESSDPGSRAGSNDNTVPEIIPGKGDAGAPTVEAEPKPEPTLVDPFVCDDGSEIDLSLHCNSKAECPDGSDELGCPAEPFFCATGAKVHPSLVCNGKDECGDGSDELGCTANPPEECVSGVDQALPFDPGHGCWLPQIPIGCAKLNDPPLSVPTNWGDTTCARRERDGVLFLVPEPQLATDWDDCTPAELAAIADAGSCP